MSTNTLNPRLPAAKAATGGDYLRQFAVIVITLVTISINVLANIVKYNGQETGQISDKYPTLFTPAGYVFAIWGVVYLGMLAYMVYQALPAQRTNPRLRASGWPYVIANLANCVWIFLWHYEQFLISVGVILVLLAGLAVAYVRIAPARRQVPRAEFWTTHIPFSIYLGWVSVATIANVAVWLVASGYSGAPLSPAVWSVLMLIVATALGAFFLRRFRDLAYAGVLVWAFAGIAVKQSATPLVAIVAAALAVVVLADAILTYMRTRNTPGHAATTAKQD